MTIFIADKLIRVIQKDKLHRYLGSHFDAIFDAKVNKFKLSALKGHVIVQNANAKFLDDFFHAIISKKIIPYESLTLLVESKQAAQQQIVSYFEVVYAAGGIVFNTSNETLFMKRLSKWDLPKGKAEKGESSRETAEREVEEECGIKIKLGKKITTTWHTYKLKGKPVIKRTKWYAMKCTDASKMQPQIEEDIEELCWMNKTQIKEAMLNSYASIEFVVNEAGLLLEDM